MTNHEFERVIEEAARQYRSSGRYAWQFARGKLRFDPLFRGLLHELHAIERGTILDLGCGQGLLFACLAAARGSSIGRAVNLHGIELRAAASSVARRALADGAHIECSDVRHAHFPHASCIVIADVLFYMSRREQEDVLRKAVDALAAGGTLLLREADAEGGWRFRLTEWAERLTYAARGRLWQPLTYRSCDEWVTALAELGLTVTMRRLSEGTPFSNMLYVGRKH
ncbi:MAG: class I SAM-dependent methyltransferase [Pseudomonadota bacterium]